MGGVTLIFGGKHPLSIKSFRMLSLLTAIPSKVSSREIRSDPHRQVAVFMVLSQIAC